MLSRTCAQCGSTETRKWYSGPVCYECYYPAHNKSYYAKNREKLIAASKEYAKRAPIVNRKATLRAKYRITLEDYNNMLAAQAGKCAICGTDKPGRRGVKYLCVDHCHKTGKVRGLLCVQCNSALGQLQDNLQTLQSAIEYLKQHG